MVYVRFIYGYLGLPDGQNRTSENRFFHFSQHKKNIFFSKSNILDRTRKHFPTAFEAKKKIPQKYFFSRKSLFARARDIEIEFEREREISAKKPSAL